MSRRGKFWSLEEEASLLESIAKGEDCGTIAQKLKRSERGILARVQGIGCRLNKEGVNKEEILKKTGLTQVQYDEALIKYGEKFPSVPPPEDDIKEPRSRPNINLIFEIYSLVQNIDIRLQRIEAKLNIVSKVESDN